MRQLIEEKILPRVQKPARYLGSEWNIIQKPWEQVPVRMVFAFPDVYEIGMSHLGLRILYGLVNEDANFLMERVFAPWVDMESKLREHHIPLFSLESYRPLREFDVIGFTLQYEMSYTNILNMLDLSGIPLKSKDRDASHPLVIAGGPCALNPEPLAEFIDCFLLGDSEELLPEVLRLIHRCKDKDERVDRLRFLEEAAGINGVYVPAFYDVTYNPDGSISDVSPNRPGVPSIVMRRIVESLDLSYFPTKPIVPFMDIVHDRIMLEVLRGCTRGCRFCQAGMVYRPVRERTPETLLKQAEELISNTGYDEISLTSLSTADYTCVEPLIKKLNTDFKGRGVGLSLPSLRVDAFSVNLAQEIQQVRKSTLTFAPEAGTQRLRDVINKGVNESNLTDTVRGAFEAGWTAVKLYFMIGLPTEEDIDLDGIADLARLVLRQGDEVRKGVSPKTRVTVSLSSFVPKAHTPFQWEPQDTIKVLREKQAYMRRKLRDGRISFHWHEPELSFLEAVFARGGRRLSAVLEEAWRKGCKFDSWSEHFQYNTWMEAFAVIGVDPEFYAYRKMEYTEVLPWDHLDAGVTKSFLIREHQKALAGKLTGDCRGKTCPGCGICTGMGVELDLKGGWQHETHTD
ncbi:MAG: TIGR03960 family B12-binding radical SAM protein [Bacillota bacterium]